MRPEPGWPRALERAAAARVVLILGDTDSGKTALATYLAGALAAGGLDVGVVDADPGQSQVGPPTTVGLGRVTGSIGALADAERLALAWVGGTSPSGCAPALWAGAGRLVKQARARGLRPVVVDTCGLVRGGLGRSVQLGTVRATAPDLVVCLSRDGECAAILGALASRPGLDVLALPVGPAARRRGAGERRRHRESGLATYFAGAVVRAVPLGALDDGAVAADVEGRLVGLLDEGGETLGIGRIVAVDAVGRRLLVETPVEGAAVARVALGRSAVETHDRHEVRA